MFDDLDDGAAAAALAAFHDAVSGLIALSTTGRPGTVVMQVLRGVQTETNRLAVADYAFIAELQSQGTAHEHACRSTATFLSQLLRIHPLEAGARVKAAAEMGPRRDLSGQALPPRFEQVAAAQAAGAISPAHARVITKSLTELSMLPEPLTPEAEDIVQDGLVAQARQHNPAQLASIATGIAARIDQDGRPPNEDERVRRRDLRIRRRDDGSAQLSGELTALCAEAVLSLLDSLAKPKPARDGAKDPRTCGQRLHDALYDATLIALRSQQLPDCGGVAATILLTMTVEQFQRGTGLVQTANGARISMGEAMTLFGDSRIMPVVLGKSREIIAYGTTHRIFTEGQRLAMTARDHGCTFPGCTEAPTRCQSHHITDYSITRHTRVDDGTLLCGYHHREHPTLGWSCHMINGIPHWTAPRWIDPTQTPQRNTANDLVPV